MTSPQTSFGAASFQIVHEGEWLPVWQEESYTVTHHVPGGGNVTQLLGLGPLVVTYTIECDTQDDYADLVALKQTSGTLRIPANIAEAGIGTEVVLFGTVYTEISDVTLMDIARPMIALNQCIQAEATFQLQERPA